MSGTVLRPHRDRSTADILEGELYYHPGTMDDSVNLAEGGKVSRTGRARMRGAHIRTPAALVVLTLVAGCGGDDERRPKQSRPPVVGPAGPRETTERPAPPAVPDGGLDRGHG